VRLLFIRAVRMSALEMRNLHNDAFDIEQAA
jgi:hypothetical protein